MVCPRFSGSPATNGGEYILKGAGDDPIQTAIGTAQTQQNGGLVNHSIANITLPDHVLHNENMSGWPICPKPVPNVGNGIPPATGTPPADCNQIYRVPYIDNGQVRVRTRGTGSNRFDWLNEKILGPYGFNKLDAAMKKAIEEAPGHLCPNL